MGKKEGREGKELRSEEMEVELLFLAGREECVGGVGGLRVWVFDVGLYVSLICI